VTTIPDDRTCYRAVAGRDPRFDGWIYVGVTSTGIYCRPSCPATTPKITNCRFFAAAGAAQHAGFRACRRCHPDAVPGSPQWNLRADTVGRAMRLIDDGALDRGSVGELAAELGYSERQLHRLLVAEVGAGPLTLARAQRAHAARLLVESTRLPMTDVAFAAGFASVRQFNDTVRAVFGTSPTALRAKTSPATTGETGRLTLSLPVRAPYAGAELLGFLTHRVIEGVEAVVPTGSRAGAGDQPAGYARSCALEHGDAVVTLTAARPDRLGVAVELADLRDLGSLVARLRRLADADADPAAVDQVLGADPTLRPLVARRPGLRVPGTTDAPELAVRALIGQQVSLAGAAVCAAKLTRSYGRPLARPSAVAGVTHLFPTSAALAEVDPATLPMPRARGRALVALAAALRDGRVDLSVGCDRAEARRQLLAQPGIGPWTADYVALRGLGDPDVLLDTDLAVKRELVRRRVTDPAAWAPWRSYATLHLWHGYLAGDD
jgi:AraC family transcriptional regulator of adaptative response / DNA-3-methyladenine glycosylase II